MTSKHFIASLLASALLAGLGMSPAMAQQGTYTPGIDHTQQSISVRIQQGLTAGYITPSEAQVLYRRDRDIEMRENQFKANGNASQQERQELRAELDALNADVDRMMSNRNAARTPGIDYREFQISQRIDEGVRSGRISEHDARRLHSRERDIERHEAYFKADGVVTWQESRQLRNEAMALRDEVERMLRNGRYDHHGRG